MEKSDNSNSELSEDCDVSVQPENTIDDSLLTSEEDTFYDKNYRHKLLFKKKKSPILDSTNDMNDTSVLGVSEINSEVIENSYTSDHEKEPVQQSPKSSAVQITNKSIMDKNVADDSDTDNENSFIRHRVIKNRIISSDSSDTEAVMPRRNNKNKSKISTIESSDSSDDDKTVDLSFAKHVSQNISSSFKHYNRRTRTTHEDSGYRRQSRPSPNNKNKSDMSSTPVKNCGQSDIDKTIDLSIAKSSFVQGVSENISSTPTQYNHYFKSTGDDSDYRRNQASSSSGPDKNDRKNVSKQNEMKDKSSKLSSIDQVVANISVELSKSRIGERESDSPNIVESESSESDGPMKVTRPDLRLSEEFRFGKGRNILHSTLLEPHGSINTPVNKITGKRLLNKSIDTPRTIKQIKESDTPRNVPQILSDSSSSDVHCKSEDDDIIDVSSDEGALPKTPIRNNMKQTTLDDLIVKTKPSILVEIKKEQNSSIVEVSPAEYKIQEYKVKSVESDLLKAKNLIKAVNLEFLPDKGKSIQLRQQSLESQLLEEVKKLSTMKVTKENIQPSGTANTNSQSKIKILSWEEMEAKAGVVQPRTFGKQAMSTYNAQKAVTMDRLHQLHGSLKTCPGESDVAEDPKGLKVELMPHQRRALAWLMWREMQKPSGGILADDMGLGKTLTMIALMLKTKETEKDPGDSSEEENSPLNRQKFNGGTLVICPASLINQWSGELEKRARRGLASYEMYHGPKRETKPKKLAQHDMVITTYSIVNNECERNGAVFRVKWRRIVIDEAHQIRNHKSQTSEAVCKLAAKSRWALTGTPVHNKELDMYALMKFIRCTPFDDLAVWKRWVGDKSTGGTERLHTVISSLMLRRTKVELIEKGFLNAMPERKWELIQVELTKKERDVYSKILIFSRTLFAQFLHQRADKNQDANLAQCDNLTRQPNGQNQEYVKMREQMLRLNKLKDIKQHEILVLLLRLRQICCHPSLITSMLHEDMEILGEDDDGDKGNALDFLEQLNKLTLDGDEQHPNTNVAEGIGEEALGLKEAARGVLNPTDPIFSDTSMSSKIKELIRVLKEKVLITDDKAIIVSQWSSFLRLISHHLKEERINFDQLDGTVPVHKRMDMVNRFNDPKDKMRVLLLSLTAGGVGLNLIGANHLFLLDLHWNPQLENQAQDRIYRLGQKKEVNVYKFMATDTIEKRILDLQEKKLEIAQSMLTGTKHVMTSKLSLQDLKMLFEM